MQYTIHDQHRRSMRQHSWSHQMQHCETTWNMATIWTTILSAYSSKISPCKQASPLTPSHRLRQATEYNLAATTAPSQAPAVTTFYMNQKIGTTVTWAPIVYTQVFADVPDQLPSPGVGSIGLGNLVKQEKRDAAPPSAGIAGRIPR